MANVDHIHTLKMGSDVWNNWRKVHNNSSIIDLSGVDLRGYNLSNSDLNSVNLSNADLRLAGLSNANLNQADLSNANLNQADLSNASLSFANLTNAKLCYAELQKANLFLANLSGANLYCANLIDSFLDSVNFSNSDLSEAALHFADLRNADLSCANLRSAFLNNTNLQNANFRGANLNSADLTNAICVGTSFSFANIENARIYGISVWDIDKKNLNSKNLIITKKDDNLVTVDNIEIAQFIYLLLNNEKIREVISTISKKAVLILGRFTPERKMILDAIRENLRYYDFVPIMFDFEKANSKDFTETIKILAGLSRFVIADITNPKSAPLELQAIVPDYSIPIVPIIESGESPFSMFQDLAKYPWMLQLIQYTKIEDIIENFKMGIIKRALEAETKLMRDKNNPLPPNLNFTDFK